MKEWELDVCRLAELLRVYRLSIKFVPTTTGRDLYIYIDIYSFTGTM